MKLSGPLMTLLAGGVLAAGVGGLSVRAASNDSADAGAKGKAPAAAAPGTSAPGNKASAGAAPEQGAPTSTAPAAQNVKRDYAGFTVGGAATLAIAVRGDKAIAYLCDGKVVEAWLRGTVTNGTYDLKGKNGAHLTGSTSGAGKIAGEALVRGTSFDFNVKPVKRPSGLWRLTAEVRGAKVDGGWIVLPPPDSRQIGLLDTNGTPGPAPSLDPNTGSVNVNGETVRAGEASP
jgi:hypothetical protein